MTTYSDIADTEVDPESPLTTSLAFKWRDNPLAIFEGDATALAASKGLAIEYDSGAGTATAVLTDETDTTLVLGPDGSGSVAFKPGGVGQYFAAQRDSGDGTLPLNSNVTWTEVADTGSDFDGTTYTVPADGVYEFTIHAGVAPNLGNAFKLEFHINGSLDETLIEASGGGFTDEGQVHRTMVKSLTQGDTVTIYADQDLSSPAGFMSGWNLDTDAGLASPAVQRSGDAYWIGRRVA